ncbi:MULTISPECIES: hypothetical protein [Pseudomonas]|uniref:Uncharacterized protein n=1 Tax=Pseudomonas donghuensis TaxID=1163398 RepID=A0AAQ0DPN8_9PSED|nr:MULTISPECIES: hypothetical protein [Pseudomonas]MDF9894461.1 hypothetical protein [Pseudomonas vranovensis]MBF4210859.1 hypothetical protein [Pseudomonas donghuensis]MBS7596930.1 hypothetical protein [Pseudomonas sp. RC2C2]MCP6692354.1 hypothetical protein [Pseudomonas donghuensis]MCP6698280.1 hypothetical protein [Pseudomonas donghuensis]
MDANAFAKALKTSISEVKSQGHETVNCDKLITYIDRVVEATSTDNNPEENSEVLKARLQLSLDAHKHNLSANLEMFKSIIQSGQNALKTMLLLNGGAAIALLAFIGKLSDNNSSAIPDFAYSLTAFVIGALAIGITSCLTYLSQMAFDSAVKWHNNVATTLHATCGALGLVSISAFAYGTYKTYQAFLCLATCA